MRALAGKCKRPEAGSEMTGVVMSESAQIRIRCAKHSDLEAANAVIAAAITSWDLPARVERLIRPIYQYDEHDFQHLEMLVAETAARDIVGVAAWEPANAGDAPRGQKSMVLHGIYTSPKFQRLGIANRLVRRVKQAAGRAGCAGLLAKASRNARAFYRATGWRSLEVENPDRDYPYRFWLDVEGD